MAEIQIVHVGPVPQDKRPYVARCIIAADMPWSMGIHAVSAERALAIATTSVDVFVEALGVDRSSVSIETPNGVIQCWEES